MDIAIGHPFRQYMARNAFTLIEMLVVISIISVLIAILLPALSSARSAAQLMQSCNNQRQILLALRSYAFDNDGLFPHDYNNLDTGSIGGAYTYWPRTLVRLGYLQTGAVFFSPATSWGVSRPNLKKPEVADGDPWAFPSYGISRRGATEELTSSRRWQSANLNQAFSVASESEWMIIRHVWHPTRPDQDHGYYRFSLSSNLPPDGSYYNSQVAAGYADGHVQAMTTEALRELSGQATTSGEAPYFYNRLVKPLP